MVRGAVIPQLGEATLDPDVVVLGGALGGGRVGGGRSHEGHQEDDPHLWVV